MNDTVTAKEIAAALGVTERSIRRRAERERWECTVKAVRGGQQSRYPIASLPEPVRIALARQISRPALGIIQGGKADTVASPNIAPASMPASPLSAPPEPALPPAALDKAAFKADLVKAYLEAKAWGRKHGESMAKCREAFVRGYNSGAFLAPLHEQLGDTSWKTLERWALELRRADYDCAAIAPKYGLHRQGICKVTDAESEELLKLLLSQSQFKIGTAITLVKMHLGDASPSSASTLRNFAEAFKREHADVWTLAREGEKALTDTIAPFLRRDWDLLEVGDVLIADGHRLNFRIKHPIHGRPCRASLVAFEDGRSRDICGYTFMLEEDLAAIHLALYRSILRLGKTPKAVLLDNGKAFKAKVFTDKGLDLRTSGVAGLYGRLGIQCHFAKPYNSRSKPIEPFWATVGLSFEKAVSSYCGRSIDTKPARMRRNEKFMQAIEPESLITMEEAAGLFESWLDTFYRVKPHSGLAGKTPGEVFAAGRGPGLEHARVPEGDDVTVAVGEDAVRIISDHGAAVGVCPAFPGYPMVITENGSAQRMLPFPASWEAAKTWAANPPAGTGMPMPMSFEAFIRRFSETELEAATALARTDVKVDIFWKRVMAAASSGIDLTYQPVIDGVNYLVGKIDGFDQARANAVLGIAS